MKAAGTMHPGSSVVNEDACRQAPIRLKVMRYPNM